MEEEIKYPYVIKVTKKRNDFFVFHEHRQWLRANCRGGVKMKETGDGLTMELFFQDNQDAVYFKMVRL